MKSIALRFSEKFSPEDGTIKEHEKIIEKFGFAWYGKMGSKVTSSYMEEIMHNEDPKILLIHSGGTERYWAYVSDYSDRQPDPQYIPAYYRNMADKFHYWFKITRFEKADRDIMAKCTVPSSGSTLSTASKYSMSPYFKIECKL